MSEKIVDTYFFDSSVALEIALKKNKAETLNPNVKGLQICYYNGEKLSNAPKNCIHLPLEEIYSYFITTNNRFPQFVSFNNTNFSQKDQRDFNQKMTDILSLSIAGNNLLVETYKKKIKKNKPDFSEKRLRVFIAGCRETTVMQHISKNIAEAFKTLGYHVKYHIQKNDMESCGALANLKVLHKFNPHITININHFNNEYLHKSILNFVWFQDTMPNLVDKTKIKMRKNDTVFSLNEGIRSKLLQKSIPNKIQHFNIDTITYKKRKSIKRENKIVFIGTSYRHKISSIQDKEILNELIHIFETSQNIKDSDIKNISITHKADINKIQSILGYVYRDYFILKMCALNFKNYTIEIYGWGWEKYPELQKYFKGTLKYGKSISKVYNSAQFALIPAGGYILQQRTLEAIASGTIPLIYDNRHLKNVKAPYHEEALEYFSSFNHMKNILKKDLKKDLKSILCDYKYSTFAKKIIKVVHESL